MCFSFRFSTTEPFEIGFLSLSPSAKLYGRYKIPTLDGFLALENPPTDYTTLMLNRLDRPDDSIVGSYKDRDILILSKPRSSRPEQEKLFLLPKLAKILPADRSANFWVWDFDFLNRPLFWVFTKLFSNWNQSYKIESKKFLVSKLGYDWTCWFKLSKRKFLVMFCLSEPTPSGNCPNEQRLYELVGYPRATNRIVRINSQGNLSWGFVR